MKTYQIDQESEELEKRLADLKQQREQAAQAEHDAKVDQIAAHEDNAAAYRQQAAKAVNDTEKQNCYRYADLEEQQANELRKELGLAVPEPEPEPEPVDPTEGKRDEANGVINSLLIIALSTGASLLTSDYIAGILDGGVLSFLLHTVARLSYAGFLVSAVLWASLRAVVWFIPDYFPGKLYDDFAGAKPRTRLYILTGFALSVLYLLSTIGHAK